MSLKGFILASKSRGMMPEVSSWVRERVLPIVKVFPGSGSGSREVLGEEEDRLIVMVRVGVVCRANHTHLIPSGHTPGRLH